MECMTDRSYHFCPLCGGRLESRIEHPEDGRLQPTCTACGFIFYQASKPTASTLIESQGRLLLVRRLQAPYKGWWDMPGGFLEPGEHPEDGARREAREETGLDVRLLGLFAVLMDVYRLGPVPTPTLNLFYRAELSGGDLRSSFETAEPRWFAPADLPKRLAFACVRQAVALWKQPVASRYDNA
jgi:8-oxo-dGTP diphosphatase